MSSTRLECRCGAVQVQVDGEPMARFLCHCDDCQAVHGAAYPSALFSAIAVAIVRGETEDFTLKNTPRTKCSRCGTYLFAEVPGYGVRGVNGGLFSNSTFIPEFHVQCRFAALPIEDDLPHYKGNPARFHGSDEQMRW